MLTPVTREEMFLYAIQSGEASNLPTPSTRKEMFLNAIITQETTGLPAPSTRVEQFLYAIITNDGTGLPTPSTREEMFLNAIRTGDVAGLPLPVTRTEMFLCGIVLPSGLTSLPYIPSPASDAATYNASLYAWANANYEYAYSSNLDNNSFVVCYISSGNHLLYVSDETELEISRISRSIASGVYTQTTLSFNPTHSSAYDLYYTAGSSALTGEFSCPTFDSIDAALATIRYYLDSANLR